MMPTRVIVNGVSIHGYFYACFAGIWVIHPASRRKCFSEIRGSKPEIVAARLLRELAARETVARDQVVREAKPRRSGRA
jgi:ribosomal protein L20A (L18A)